MSETLEALKASILEDTIDPMYSKNTNELPLHKRDILHDFEAKTMTVGHVKTSVREAMKSIGILLNLSTTRARADIYHSGGLKEGKKSTKDAGRSEYRSLLNDVEMGHAFGTWSIMNLSRTAIAEVGQSVDGAISDAVLCLLQDNEVMDVESRTMSGSERSFSGSVQSESQTSFGRVSERKDNRKAPLNSHESAPKVLVWPNSQNARVAIIRHALVAKYGHIKNVPVGAAMAGAPLVLLVRERLLTASSPEDLLVKAAFADASEVRSGEELIGDWSAALFGMAVMSVLDVDSLNDIASAVDVQLSNKHARSNLAPILVVVRALHESTITTKSFHLRAVCARHGARLHLEGPAVSAVARVDGTVQNITTFQCFDTLLLEPAAWFGVRACAVATFHQAGSMPPTEEDNDPRVKGTSSQTLESLSETSIGPLFGLWMLLSRLGLCHSRSLVSKATNLSQLLTSELSGIPNLGTVSCGLGSTVKVSYVLSRADRLVRKYKAREEISKVNGALFSQIAEEARELSMRLSVENKQTWIVFSASRLMEEACLEVPSDACIHNLVRRLRDIASKYEMCCIGSSPYTSRICRLSDYQVVTEAEVGPSYVLCYGAFRIVPDEFDSSWREDEAQLDVVHDLTARLAMALAEKLQEHNNSARMKQEHRRKSSLTDNTRSLSTLLSSLPFEFFLHAQNADGVPDFLTVEVCDSGKPAKAINEATMAADFVSDCVTKVRNCWRGIEASPVRPHTLANVAGLDTFVGDKRTPRSTPKTDISDEKTGSDPAYKSVKDNEAMGVCKAQPQDLATQRSLEREDAINERTLPQLNDIGVEDHLDKYYSADEGPSSAFPDVTGEHMEPLYTRGPPAPIEDSLGAFPSARSHWLGFDNDSGTRRGGERNSNRKRRHSGSSENTEESGESSKSDSSSSDGRASDSNSERSSSDSGESTDNKNNHRRGGGKSKNRRVRSGKTAIDEEGNDESDSEWSEGDSEGDSGQLATSRREPSVRRTLLSWWRGKAVLPGIEDVADRQKSDLSSESSNNSRSNNQGPVKQNHRRGSQSYQSESEEDSESNDADSDEDAHHSDEDESDSADESEDYARSKNSVIFASMGVNRFGFNWLSKKVLPAGNATSEEATSSRSRSRARSQSQDRSIQHYAAKKTVRARDESNRRYSSTSSHDALSHRESSDYSDKSSDNSSGEDSRPGSRATTGSPKVDAESRGWFSRRATVTTHRASASKVSQEQRGIDRPRQSRDASFSSESSDYEAHNSDRRRGQPASTSSVLSLFGGTNSPMKAGAPRTSRGKTSSGRRR